MSKSVGILGCGWLGTPLAESLLADKHTVKGTTTSHEKLPALKEKGIDAFEISIFEDRITGNIQGFLKNLDILIINIPPKLRNPSSGDFIKKVELLSKELIDSKISKVLFISSTSVYGNVEGEVTEDTIPEPITKSGKQLLIAEKYLVEQNHFSTTILRFGGLIGEDRHPVYQLSGKTMTNGEELVNLIHRKDCIYMIKTIIKNGYWNEIFNGVYPYHPSKADYYISEAKKREIPPPVYISGPRKVVKKSIVLKNFYVKMHDLTTSISF